MWIGKDAVFLLRQVTLILCLHPFIACNCRNQSKMKILKHKPIISFLMLRQLQNALLRVLFLCQFSVQNSFQNLKLSIMRGNAILEQQIHQLTMLRILIFSF